MKAKKLKIILILLFLILVSSSIFFSIIITKKENRTIDDILINGNLQVSMLPNHYDYFLYNTEIHGANYEILLEFAKYLNVELRINKNDNRENNDIFITDKKYYNRDIFYKIEELEKKYHYTIISIDSNINLKDNFYIININNSLFKRIFNKKKIALCEINLAKFLINNEIKIINDSLKIERYINFYVKKNDKKIADSFFEWYKEFIKTKKYHNIEKKYFSQRNSYYKPNNYFFSMNNSVISPYDDEIKKYCEKWDWRFISALIYEESRFNPNAINTESGAFGLMQLLPYNMDIYAFDTSLNVESQIYSGIQLLNRIDKEITPNISDYETRNKIILSAYLVGLSHVLDAIALSEKYSINDKYKWNGIGYYLENLSNSDYYEDSVVKRGKCNCVSSVVYANKIYNRYLNYKNLVE